MNLGSRVAAAQRSLILKTEPTPPFPPSGLTSPLQVRLKHTLGISVLHLIIEHAPPDRRLLRPATVVPLLL
jgi:hypothetical protein